MRKDPYNKYKYAFLSLIVKEGSLDKALVMFLGACVLFPLAKPLDKYLQEVSNKIPNSIAKSISIGSVRILLELITCGLSSRLGPVILLGLASAISNDHEHPVSKLSPGSFHISNEFVISLVTRHTANDLVSVILGATLAELNRIVVALFDSVLSLMATAFNYVTQTFSRYNQGQAPEPVSIAARPN